jgi:hypothetical protein
MPAIKPTAAVPATKVKFTNTHHRMALVATFPNNEQFKFTVTNNGYSIAFAQLPSSQKITKGQGDLFDALCKFHVGDTTNTERFARIKAACEASPDWAALLRIAADTMANVVPPKKPVEVTGADLDKPQGMLVVMIGETNIAPKGTSTLTEASAAYRKYIEDNNLGASKAKKCTAFSGTQRWTISYNGTVWTV